METSLSVACSNFDRFPRNDDRMPEVPLEKFLIVGYILVHYLQPTHIKNKTLGAAHEGHHKGSSLIISYQKSLF